MALAWEMLEVARLIYNAHGGAASHAARLADVALCTADILAEQVGWSAGSACVMQGASLLQLACVRARTAVAAWRSQHPASRQPCDTPSHMRVCLTQERFEDAAAEYAAAEALVAALPGGLEAHRRFAAEIEFKRATALELSDQPAAALESMQAAKRYLQGHLDVLNEKLLAAAGSAGAGAVKPGDSAGAAASAAFAAMLSSYAPPAPAPAAPAAAGGAGAGAEGREEEQDGAAAAAAKLRAETADLRRTLGDVDERIEELRAAVAERKSMKEALASTFALVAGAGGGEDEQEAAAQQGQGGAGGSGSGFAAPSAAAAAAPVRDMGVIGKGRRVAPTPTTGAGAGAASGANGAAAAPAASPGEEHSKKRPLSDVSSGDQQQGGKGGGGEAAASKVPPAAAPAAADQQAKKARA